MDPLGYEETVKEEITARLQSVRAKITRENDAVQTARREAKEAQARADRLITLAKGYAVLLDGMK
jgi:ribosomal protein L17